MASAAACKHRVHCSPQVRLLLLFVLVSWNVMGSSNVGASYVWQESEAVVLQHLRTAHAKLTDALANHHV
jgi:hypothetical protein